MYVQRIYKNENLLKIDLLEKLKSQIKLSNQPGPGFVSTTAVNRLAVLQGQSFSRLQILEAD